MNIVVLNESFLKDDQIDRLKKLGNVQVYTDTKNPNRAVIRKRIDTFSERGRIVLIRRLLFSS